MDCELKLKRRKSTAQWRIQIFEKKKYRQLNQKVQRIKDRMAAGQVSICKYLDAIGL